ncbi:MAG: SH3 domain-containing protein [Clostridia bacterium]|nr:SH3 domain-containing protein [Clostridia bacterium]
MNLKKPMMYLTGLTLAMSLTVSSALADSATVSAEKSANIRSGAGMNHPVIGWAMKGDEFETLGTSGNWTRVALKGGKEGYIHTSLLTADSVSAPSGSVTVTAEKSANIRKEPGMSGKVIGWAMKGDQLTVLEKGAKWTKVETKKGTVGYIHNSLLSGSASAPSAGKTATISAEKSANIRSEAGMNGKVIGWAMKDETVIVLEKGSKWTKVETEDGLVGYIHNSLLK